ncbi:nucleic-acid-binding protein from transposon X-element [Trichonephila clavipes]|nr:nucleic-acid-binding protein from transposon X-element [Trichonephila clavipes]
MSGWFHSSEVCHLPPRCVKCAGPHAAKDCTLDFNDPMKCANCSGAHAANWSRCPKHPKNSKKKNLAKNKNGPKPNNPNSNSAKNLNKNNLRRHLDLIFQRREKFANLDYSKVVQNKIPKEHVSPPSTSKSELRPAPCKDASINAGLLKDLLEVIEESPSIDKQTFAGRLKNSLSALRSASADVDKRMYFRSLLQASLPPGLTFPAHVSTSLKIDFGTQIHCVKIHEVRDFVSEQNLDMFLVQETWLEPGIDPQIANYRLTKDDRIEFPHTATRGGTAIYCKNEIVHHRVPFLIYKEWTPLRCKLKLIISLPLMLFRPTFEEEQAIVSQ